MKLLAILLLAITAHGHAPRPAVSYPRCPVVRTEISRTMRIIDSGRRMESVTRFNDGTSRRHIFELPTIRTP